MLSLNNNTISIIRGDSGIIDLVIYTSNGLIYEIQENDIVSFIVFKKNNLYIKNHNIKPIISKQFSDRKIAINPEDTKYLETGIYGYRVILQRKEEENFKEIDTVLFGDFIIK